MQARKLSKIQRDAVLYFATLEKHLFCIGQLRWNHVGLYLQSQTKLQKSNSINRRRVCTANAANKSDDIFPAKKQLEA